MWTELELGNAYRMSEMANNRPIEQINSDDSFRPPSVRNRRSVTYPPRHRLHAARCRPGRAGRAAKPQPALPRQSDAIGTIGYALSDIAENIAKCLAIVGKKEMLTRCGAVFQDVCRGLAVQIEADCVDDNPVFFHVVAEPPCLGVGIAVRGGVPGVEFAIGHDDRDLHNSVVAIVSWLAFDWPDAGPVG